jgi:signal peptidase I
MKLRILVLTFVLVLVGIGLSSTYARAVPDEYTSYLIAGDSMVPTLKIGDLITVRTDVNASNVLAAPYPDGDIIVFHRPKSNSSDSDVIVAHRAVESIVNSNTGIVFFRTKGDNNTSADSFVSDYRGENYSMNGMVSDKLLIGKAIAHSKHSLAGSWVGISYNLTVYTSSTVTDPVFSQSEKKVQFDVVGYASYSTSGFCNVTIPKAILNCSSLTDWQVKLNSTDINYAASQNATHTFIYFEYTYSTHHIEITGTQAMTGQQTDSDFPWGTVAAVAAIAGVAAVSVSLYSTKRRRAARKNETPQHAPDMT